MQNGASAASARHRIRAKTRYDPVEPEVGKTQATPQKKVGKTPATPDAKEKEKKETTPEKATKARAARGTVGTFCGRRVPDDPVAAEEFRHIRDAYYAEKARFMNLKGEQKKGKSKKNIKPPKAEAYYADMREKMTKLKQQMPGQTGSWYLIQAMKERVEVSGCLGGESSSKRARQEMNEKGAVEEQEEGAVENEGEEEGAVKEEEEGAEEGAVKEQEVEVEEVKEQEVKEQDVRQERESDGDAEQEEDFWRGLLDDEKEEKGEEMKEKEEERWKRTSERANGRRGV